MHRSLQMARNRFRRAAEWLWSQEGSAGQRARGIAAGVFCGCFPFFGLQIVLSVGIATLLRGNHLLAAAGTLVSNPLTYIPLYWFNYLVGCKLLNTSNNIVELSSINRSNLWMQGWEFSQRILLGSSLVGAVLALATGILAFKVFQKKSLKCNQKKLCGFESPKPDVKAMSPKFSPQRREGPGTWSQQNE